MAPGKETPVVSRRRLYLSRKIRSMTPQTFRSSMTTFITVWAGQLVSTLGSALTNFAMGVWVYQETGSPTLFTLTMLSSALPYVALSPLAGVIADRWDRSNLRLSSRSNG